MRAILSTSLILFALNPVFGEGEANDWLFWRGPHGNGSVDGADLVTQWSKDGENLIWRADFIGRSTPAVFDGKVYVLGRVGDGPTMQERVAAFDARTGDLLWDYNYNVYDTAVPFKRVAWTSPAVDPETGYVYTVGGGALVNCLDSGGKLQWSRNMTDEYGAITGYGGRTITPLVHEGEVIVSFVTSGWGSHGAPKQRFYAFDKKSGQVVWIGEPGGNFETPNIYSTPVIADIGGKRMLIGGNADGSIYGILARTGEKVWSFNFSKRGMNASVAVADNYVYATHSEENLDQPFLGRLVCIDATGKGDVTATHEVWRVEKIEAGYTTPAVAGGKVYVVDNSANFHCFDAKTGEKRWSHSLGTVGKGSPVVVGDKILVPETNGKFFILQEGPEGVKVLDEEFLTVPGGRYAEIYGSPAIAYNRIYFTTEEGIYCVGDKSAPFQMKSTKYEPPPKAGGQAKPAHLQVVPGEAILTPGENAKFIARSFDENGVPIGEVEAKWKLLGLEGVWSGNALKPAAKAQAGMVEAEYQGLKAQSRIRVFPDFPWVEDFEGIDVDKNPAYWVRAGNARSPASKFIVKEIDGNKVLVKVMTKKGVQRSTAYVGPPSAKNYVIQVDVKGTRLKRYHPDIGIHSHGYTLDMMGNHQRLAIRSWISENRMAQTQSFKWEPEVWYTMKLQVDHLDGKAVIKGKVWPTAEKEPDEWTITAEDHLPITHGSPGLYGFSTADIYYDNLKITENTQ